MRARTRIVYISGFGRSGSSLLESLLAADVPALSTGELCNLFAWAHESKPCTCGVPVTTCPVWGPVLDAVMRRSGRSAQQLDQLTRQAERDRSSDEAAWSEIWGSTLRALEDIHGTRAIIDSSKSASGMRRMELLSRLEDCEVSLAIQMVRSLGGVTYSVRSGSNRLLEADNPTHIRMVQTKATYGWLAANLSARRQEIAARQSMRIRYEDLPRQIEDVRRTARHALRDVSGMTEWGHAIAGNRMFRSGSPIRISADERWRTDLHPLRRLTANAVERIAVRTGVVPAPATAPPAAPGAGR